MPEEHDGQVPLAKAIAAVREELKQAQDEGAGEDVRFTVGPVVIDFAAEVTGTKGGEASIKVFNILSIGGSGERSRSESNRVTVTLTPHGRHGEPFEAASQQAERPDSLHSKHRSNPRSATSCRAGFRCRCDSASS